MQKTATDSWRFNTASLSFHHISQKRCDTGLQSPRPSSVKHDTLYIFFFFLFCLFSGRCVFWNRKVFFVWSYANITTALWCEIELSTLLEEASCGQLHFQPQKVFARSENQLKLLLWKIQSGSLVTSCLAVFVQFFFPMIVYSTT